MYDYRDNPPAWHAKLQSANISQLCVCMVYFPYLGVQLACVQLIYGAVCVYVYVCVCMYVVCVLTFVIL